MSYLESVGTELKRSGWKAAIVIVFTICRLLFGWDWFKAGWDKLTTEHWLSDGKLDSAGLIKGMAANIQHAHGSDPLHLNGLLVWFAHHVFLPLDGFVDFAVVMLEMLVGICIFFGFGFVWSMVVALFLNLQYIAAGAANNFGYLVTDAVWIKYPSYASLIGIDGYIRYLRGQNLLGAAGPATRKLFNDSERGSSVPMGGSGAAKL